MYEPQHEISNNLVCSTSKGTDQPAHYAQSDQSLCSSLEYSMTLRPLTDQTAHLHSLISNFVICLFESIISKVATSEISIF